MRLSRFFSLILSGAIICFCLSALAEELPERPSDPSHPGSDIYDSQNVEKISVSANGRIGHLYIPSNYNGDELLTLIAFGHGHAVPEFSYKKMLDHIGKKGFAVLYVPYDTSWRDQDFDRMSRDYNNFVAEALEEHSDKLDPDKVVFSGHSNGALVATMASGLPENEQRVRPAQLVVFAIAGVPSDYLERLDSDLKCSFVVGDADTNTPFRVSERSYEKANCSQKQLIHMASYNDVEADHGSFRTFGWGGDQESPLHWYGYWKFLLGAAMDIENGSLGTNDWLYGDRAELTGVPGLENEIERLGF